MVRRDILPGSQCSNSAGISNRITIFGLSATNLNSVEQAQFPALRVVEVVFPLRERLEAVHQTVVEAIRRGSDEAGDACLVVNVRSCTSIADGLTGEGSKSGDI